MRALITGVKGFVGRYLAEHLVNNNYEVWGTTRDNTLKHTEISPINLIKLDLEHVDAVVDALNLIQPNYIFHLAGQSSVKQSWENSEVTFEANVLKTINLFEGIRKSNIARSVKILTVGSSEEYGKVDAVDIPITEKTILRPISPYGITKVNVYLLSQLYFNSYNLQVIHVRPFNHIGPGQSLGFVTSDFAYQIAQIEKGLYEPILTVGNLDAKRDFTDVRDIVKAYELLVKNGKTGEVYNVCSGRPVAIKEVLYSFIEMSVCKDILVKEDPTKMRPSDFPIYIGNPTKVKESTNWISTISLEYSLNQIMNYWRKENALLRSY